MGFKFHNRITTTDGILLYLYDLETEQHAWQVLLLEDLALMDVSIFSRDVMSALKCRTFEHFNEISVDL